MSKSRITIQALVLVVFTLALASLANAQATRTWVSGVGDDLNPCSRTAPCKTFAGAISKTFINGEINAIDSAGFGTITITKSITLDGAGVHASILASGVNGVNVNIATGNANDPLRNVILRNLSINGTGASGTVGTRTGVQGINVNTNGANNVWIEECVVFNFSQNGYNQVNTTTTTNVFIKNSVFRDNGGAGINASNATAGLFIKLSAEHSHFTGNANGIKGGANSRITAANCVLSGNTNAGAQSQSLTAGQNAVIQLSNCALANNGSFGIQAGGGGAAATSFIVIDDNNISGSGTSAVNVGTNGEIDTYGNNNFFGNNVNTCSPCVAISPANQ